MADITLATTYGVAYWGIMIAAVLLGISLVQAYQYFTGTGAGDSRTLQTFIAIITFFEFTCSALSFQALYEYLITDSRDPLLLLYISKTFCAEFLITIAVTFMSQLFYAKLIYNAKERALLVPGVIVVLAMGAFGTGIAIFVELFRLDRFLLDFSEGKIKIFASLNNGIAALCDIISTIAMFCFLASFRATSTGTSSLLKAIIFFTLNRGILIASSQVGHVVAYLLFPQELYWTPFHFSESKPHVITLLTMLNNRSTLRAKWGTSARSENTTTACSSMSNQIPMTPRTMAYQSSVDDLENRSSNKSASL